MQDHGVCGTRTGAEMSRTITTEDRCRIIEFVRSRPRLYDIQHCEYNVRGVTDRLWEEIGGQLGLEGMRVKSLWRNLKDSYRVQKKKHSRKYGQNFKKWMFYDKMHFMDKFIEVVTADGSAFTVAGDSREGDLQYDAEGYNVIDSLLDGIRTAEDESEGVSVDGCLSKRRRLTSVTPGPPIYIKQECGSESEYESLPPAHTPEGPPRPGYGDLQPRPGPPQDPSPDTEALYGTYVAATLRSLTPQQRQLARVRIEEIFYNIQFPAESISSGPGLASSGHGTGRTTGVIPGATPGPATEHDTRPVMPSTDS